MNLKSCATCGAYSGDACPICGKEGEAINVTTAKGKQKGNKVFDSGYTFDSETEHRRYQTLKTLQAHGLISSLEIHPKFELLAKVPKIQSAISYTADFGYWYEGKYTVEDVKGKYGKSKRNEARGIVGKPIISPESRLRHKLLIAMLYIRYGGCFEFKIITEVHEF